MQTFSFSKKRLERAGGPRLSMLLTLEKLSIKNEKRKILKLIFSFNCGKYKLK
jgi:hypothetical protein